MMRGLILLVFAGALILLFSPFLISSLYVDQRGIDMPGKVYSKREDVSMSYSTWSRDSEVTFQYDLPESGGVSFFKVSLAPERYDQFHPGQKVRLHYLRHSDIPKVPGAEFLWQVHALPVVRLADQRTFSRLEGFSTATLTFNCAAIAFLAMLLWIWRRIRLPGFSWALFAAMFIGAATLYISDFPRPTRRPVLDVRQASGKVKSVDRIDKLFDGKKSQGLIAAQPIDVVGVEFVPSGGADAVLAVDLIDRGSSPGLKQNAAVVVDYEAASPRTAYLRPATRAFVERNIAGAFRDAGLMLGLLLGLLLVAQLLGKAWNRLVHRRVET